jgi:DUF4097 and DUF4098 domain-containing protein YvlB
MKQFILPIAIGVFAIAAHRDYKLEEREAFHHTFSNDAALDVDAVSGSISVLGDGGNTIRVDGEKVIRAADQEEVQRAKREVVLDINEKSGIAQLYVNGPFRDNDHTSENHGFHDHRDREYEVAYNFTIHVPRATELTLRTVNGDESVQDTTGKFNVKGLNGKITMTNIAGSGTADTLNGSTVITFRENPKADCFFKSFNGKVDVGFQPGLSANVSVKTFNGAPYTDFEATALASTPEPGELKNGKFVFKSNRSSNLRIGSGGPELKFETFNGNIQIRKLSK